MPKVYVFTTLKPRPLLGRPKGEVEMRKVEMGGHRSLSEWAAYPPPQETPLPEVGGIGAWPQKNKENHTRDGVGKRKVGK